jgi:hypothetical protein
MIGRSHGLVAFIPLASFPCLISTFALHTSQKLLTLRSFSRAGYDARQFFVGFGAKNQPANE